MKLKCPRCKRIVKNRSLQEGEEKFYTEDELRNEEAEYHKLCSLCEPVATSI